MGSSGVGGIDIVGGPIGAKDDAGRSVCVITYRCINGGGAATMTRVGNNRTQSTHD